MYNGIRTKKRNFSYTFPEFTMVNTQEQEVLNGYIVQKHKTKKMSNVVDRKISWKDFEITSLLATGAINEAKHQEYKQSNEFIARNADAAMRTIEEIEKYGGTEQ